MASRREERERLRRERLAAQTSDQRGAQRRLIAGYFAAGILAAAVIAGLVAVIASGGGGDDVDAPGEAHVQEVSGVVAGLEFDDREGTNPPEIQFGDLNESVARAGCEAMLDLPDEGNEHFTNETLGTYKTNPPTSGAHYGNSTEPGTGANADGAYRNTPPLSRVVHSMEHGRVIIQYSPDLPEKEQLAIKGVFDEDPDGMLMFPNPGMPYEVAVTAWTNLVGCKRYDPLFLDVIRNFRDTFRGNGPEAVAISL